jgi:hypothetical protein
MITRTTATFDALGQETSILNVPEPGNVAIALAGTGTMEISVYAVVGPNNSRVELNGSPLISEGLWSLETNGFPVVAEVTSYTSGSFDVEMRG